MHSAPNNVMHAPTNQARFTTVVPWRARIRGSSTFVLLILRLKKLPEPVTKVVKKKRELHVQPQHLRLHLGRFNLET